MNASYRPKDGKLGRKFARLLEGRPYKALAVFAALIALVGSGLYYLTVKQTEVEGERCKATCAADGKLFLYAPDQMAGGYPYSKISPNCTCYGTLGFKDKGVGNVPK